MTVEPRLPSPSPEPAPAMTDATSPSPPVDLEAFRQTLEEGGIAEMLPILLDAFLQDLPARSSEVARTLDQGSPQEVARAAHALKSAAGTIHAEGLHELLARLENAAKDSVIVQMGEIGREVKGEMQRVERFLREREFQR